MNIEQFSPCDCCNVVSWSPVGEDGTTTACFSCEYYLLLREKEVNKMNEENRQKMITAMQMMKEACNTNTSWAECDNCPFDSFCDALQHHAIKVYNEDSYEEWCPMNWKPDEPEKEEEEEE